MAQAIQEVSEGHPYFWRSIVKCLRDRKSKRNQKKRQATLFLPGAAPAPLYLPAQSICFSHSVCEDGWESTG